MKKLSSRAKVSAVDAFSDAVLARWKDEAALQSDAALKSFFAELEALSAKITEATKRDKTYSDLDEKDLARDEALRNLFVVVAGFEKSPLAEFAEPASKLKKTLDKYTAGIAKLPYLEESALVVKMLQDLSAQEPKAAIEKLPGAAQLVSALSAAQEDFSKSLDEFGQAKAKEKGEVCAGEVKKEIVAIFNAKILPYLESVSALDDAHKDFAAFVFCAVERAG